jgi:hypothetical protein
MLYASFVPTLISSRSSVALTSKLGPMGSSSRGTSCIQSSCGRDVGIVATLWYMDMMGPVTAAILLYSVQGVLENSPAKIFLKLSTRRQTLSTYSRLFRMLTRTLVLDCFIDLMIDLVYDVLE